jgi:hypothetical protein
MGYRSDVAYTIRFVKEEDYHLFILEAKANPETAGCFPPNDGSHFEECELDAERLRIDFKVDNIKWYESFPEVAMHEKLIEQARAWCNDNEHISVESERWRYRLGWSFVRIGEDNNDVTEEYGGNAEWDWLFIKREIVEG